MKVMTFTLFSNNFSLRINVPTLFLLWVVYPIRNLSLGHISNYVLKWFFFFNPLIYSLYEPSVFESADDRYHHICSWMLIMFIRECWQVKIYFGYKQWMQTPTRLLNDHIVMGHANVLAVMDLSRLNKSRQCQYLTQSQNMLETCNGFIQRR